MAQTPQQLVTDANALQSINEQIRLLQIQIYLLQIIAGNNMTPQQLVAAANAYQIINDPATAEQVIIYLLQKIAGV